jgi:hypothetical protein
LRKDSHHKLETANVEYVHLVVGTGTRGISALFLARLHMTIDKCVSAGKPHYFPILQCSISCPRQRSTPCHNLENYSCVIIGAFVDIFTLPIVLLSYIGGLHGCTLSALPRVFPSNLGA